MEKNQEVEAEMRGRAEIRERGRRIVRLRAGGERVRVGVRVVRGLT